MCTECEHDAWDHELVDEGYDGIIFGACNIEGCECEQYEAP